MLPPGALNHRPPVPAPEAPPRCCVVYDVQEDLGRWSFRRWRVVYVGKTCRRVEKRWAEHVAQAMRGSMKPLHKDIRDKGTERFRAKKRKGSLTPAEALCVEAKRIDRVKPPHNTSRGCRGACDLIGSPRGGGLLGWLFGRGSGLR